MGLWRSVKMELWITSLVPFKYLNVIAPAVLIIVGLLVEKHFIGRITVVSNVIALNIFFYPLANIIPNSLIWYLNMGLIFALLGFLTYLLKESLPALYYSICFVYNSVFAGILLFWGLTL